MIMIYFYYTIYKKLYDCYYLKELLNNVLLLTSFYILSFYVLLFPSFYIFRMKTFLGFYLTFFFNDNTMIFCQMGFQNRMYLIYKQFKEHI